MSEIKVDTVAEKTSANGVTIDGLNIKDSKLVTANSVITSNVTDGNITTAKILDANITTAKILDDNVTYAKIQNVSATDRILGRDSSGAGVIEEITPANLRTMLNVADGATAGGGGKVIKFNYDNATPFLSTTSTNYSDISSVEIQPSATSSKILVMAILAEPDQIDGQIKASIIRGSTDLSTATGSGIDQGGRMLSEFGRGLSDTGTEQHFASICHFMVDAPNSTSNLTYYLKGKSNTGGAIRVGNGGASNIFVMELGA